MDRRRLALVAIPSFLACALVFLALGMWLGGHPGDLPSRLQKVFVSKDQRVRAQVIDEIQDNYYKKISKSALEQASIDGIVSSLHDRFSHYFTPQESKLFEQSVNGGEQFSGIGTTVAEDKRGLAIQEVFPGAPAARAGIRKGDVIVAVNGKSIAGEPSKLASAKVRGRAGTSVSLTVLTPATGRKRTVSVERERLRVPEVVETGVRTVNGVKIGTAHLLAFDRGAHGELKTVIDRELRQGARGILLDLRGNGGGLLDEGVLTASVFVDKGLIVSTHGRKRAEQKFYATGDAIPAKVPVVVLVDGGTASAAEIVTGALRDHGRATIVGTKTFGKGVFQEVPNLTNGGALDLTVGSFYLPNGENLAGHGIVPPVKAADDPRTKKDEALPVALRTLAAKVASGR
jgi:carboxyl-terminal processing protease